MRILLIALITALSSVAFPLSAQQEAANTSELKETAATRSSERPTEDAEPGMGVGELMRKAGQAYESGDIEAWVEATKDLHSLRPFNQDFMRQLVEGYAKLERFPDAYDMMLKMQQQGLAEDWSDVEAMAPMREHQLYDHLQQLMHEAGQPFGQLNTWAELSPEYAMPEALALDTQNDRMFVGTIREGLILASQDGESWSVFASSESFPQLASVFDMEVDHERNVLWVATGRPRQFAGEERQDGVNASLLKLNLNTGELVDEYPVSRGSGLNLIGSLEVAEDGTVFAADAQAPIIYRLSSDSDSLRPFFGHPNFTSLRGMALNGDGTLLYIADYELGIFVVDAHSGEQAWQLAIPETLNLGGIDGLFWWDQHLVAIQNGISPQRVLRLRLGEDGLGVTEVAPVAAAHEEFDTPTFGVMNESTLYFFGGSHWQYVDANGVPRMALPEVPILEIDVKGATGRVVGESILEDLMRRGTSESGASDPQNN